jgi:hypothetical protein
MDIRTMTVRELIEQLTECIDWDRDVEIWLPGSRVKLSAVLHYTKRQPKDKPLLIEGNRVELSPEDIAMGR